MKMADCMTFPQMWEQFLHDCEFEDSRRIYTNGARLIPSFRVKQMMEHYLFEAKAEAIKEFAERLKENEGRRGVPIGTIERLVKEMTEVQE
jgi:hypothetical protein